MPELMDILAKAELDVSAASTPWNVLTASWTVFDAWDRIPLARGSAITPSTDDNSMTINEAGPYSATLIINGAFDRTEELYIGMSVNGADPVKFLAEQGRGAN